MKAFILECHRRQVIHTAGLYIVCAWAVLQVAALAFDNWGIPTEAMRYLWIGAFLGFPIILILGWRFDIAGGRICRTSCDGEGIDRSLGRNDYVVLGFATVAIIALMAGVAAGVTQSTQSTPEASLARKSESNSKPDPSTFDKYLKGLELLERWDKDKNLDLAIDLFSEVLSRDPNFALAYARLADALRIRSFLTGDKTSLNEAAEYAERGVALSPDLSPVQVSLGWVHLARSNFDLAMAAMERAVSLDPNNADAVRAIAGVYARLGRMDDAEIAYRKALALDPDDHSIHDSYANFLFSQSRLDEAVEHWQTVIRITPDNYAALVNLGAVLADTGKLSEAITMYDRANEIRPTYMGYSNLGTTYSRMGRYEEAVRAYKKALQFPDADWLAWGNIAYVYSWMGKETLAAESFDHAIELAEAERKRNPREPFVNSDLALYYAKSGEVDLAVQRLETAVTLAPDSGEILAAAAETYEILGRRDEAIEAVLRSLEFGMTRQFLSRNPEFDHLLEDPRMQVSH